MLFAGLRLEVRRFFGTIMLMLGDRGYSRADRKQMIRNSGLIEKCRDYDSATYVLHYNVEDWCDYMVNGNKWPRTAEERKRYSCWH
ncbi:hypothetical protein [Selenomonas sp. AE3005]|uniref:hypothetical protein n=1 Tax=Selenomonas sp. AE3005 TaxID=1485543 RepID=UPI0025DF2856|nr:hypothetical protein [Selenomonas sp. AE3005]